MGHLLVTPSALLLRQNMHSDSALHPRLDMPMLLQAPSRSPLFSSPLSTYGSGPFSSSYYQRTFTRMLCSQWIPGQEVSVVSSPLGAGSHPLDIPGHSRLPGPINAFSTPLRR
jgi:hypothetical protein